MATNGGPGGVATTRLRSVPLFGECDATELDHIASESVLVTASAEDALVREGDSSDYAFVILTGSATVTRAGEVLASLGPGDLFGEMAMVVGGVRTATVRATTPIELLRLEPATLSRLTGTQTIAWNKLQSLLDRMPRERARAVDHQPSSAPVDRPAGEYLPVAERVVVAPRVGVFRPHSFQVVNTDDTVVTAGDVIGYVDALGDIAEVRSPFAGFLMGMLAIEGERVHTGQPIAWLRTF